MCLCMGALLAHCHMPINQFEHLPISQFEHLTALLAFAADLHRASGHLLLLYKILLCMSINRSITRGAACQVSVHGHVMSSKPVPVY